MGATSAEPREARAETGLRERKKARMRESLLDAGLRLFHERGYQATTTEEIAACAGVSQRTFFRYFASKDDIVLEAVEGVDEYLYGALRARPADEPPFTALRNAMHEHWGYLDRESLHIQGSAMGVITGNPELIDLNTRYCRSRQRRLAEVIGERTGTDPDTDPRPGVLAAVFLSVLTSAHQSWCGSGSRDTDELAGAIHDQLALVPEVVGADWGAPASAS
ncbi:TetR family transcriptional regulator [Nocardiopsis sp. CT-R113]|uniref:TetR family transcriptional regulator n=1 Tax=Nocardiopsis codii TaxID=3065942 RepID=A0ABU7K328_9ACTN|nr:TetR family transcriptional regulator [Nocardiopsis sp. CT-R113]MEE2036645.1 TetR family transcriptional regulator [Nocardiopsis sp. CT-R113]